MLVSIIGPRVGRRAGGLLRATVIALAAGGALTACTPAYDWRTIMNNDDGYTVNLPAKPSTEARQLDIGGVPMQMSMQTAEASDAVFAVGTLALPTDDPATQRIALEYLRTGLARNLGATPESHATQIPLAAGGQVPGIEMVFSGGAGPKNQHRTVHVRIVVRGRHVYQAAVVAANAVPEEQLEQFFSSFKLY